ncbi:hypothetical protein [Streptomyces sclerotialus]|uniref:hypothetical protein n=1 Tax=Streptomyces sclerotialus TaxID=1957 RepID=UPI0004C49CB9
MSPHECDPAPRLAPARRPRHRRPALSRARYGLLACLSVITAINHLDRTHLSAALPHIKEELHLSGTQQGYRTPASAPTCGSC